MKCRTVLLATGVILMLALSACGSAATSTPVPPTLVPTPRATPPQDTFLGDVIGKGGYYISALAVEDPAVVPVDFQLDAGKKLVAVELVVGNVSGARFSVSALNINLVDGDGTPYPPSLGAHADQIADIFLDKGEQAKGWIAFVVPGAVTPAGLYMSKDMFQAAFFQIGILPPPAGHSSTRLSSVRVPPQLSKPGETVEGGGDSMTVLAIEDPATPVAGYPLMPGRRLVAVEVEIANVSGPELLVSPLYFTLVDSNGFVYPAAVRARGGGMATLTLKAGDKVTGWVAFNLPADAALESLKFVPVIASDFVLLAGLTK